MPWLEEFREVPDDAVIPSYMTARHPEAVGSYGAEFVAWVAENPGINSKRTQGLRWWQRLAAYRLLEHDASGNLVWRNVLLTMARQVGKSWLLRALILWRVQQRERFGDEDQTIIHVAHSVGTASEVWRPAARWVAGAGSMAATRTGGRRDRTRQDSVRPGWRVQWAQSGQVIESPEGGRWIVKASRDGVGVGFSLSALVVDEAWQIMRAVVEAADAALSESVSPQLLLVSTAGDSASDLVATYRATALETLRDPTNVLLLEWSAPAGADLEDETGWRAASPHWSDRRRSEVLDKLAKYSELEFEQNFLNRWVDVAHGRRSTGVPLIDADDWEDRGFYLPSRDAMPGTQPVAAVEAWFGEGVAVAIARQLLDGTVGVSAESFDTVEAAAGYLLGLPDCPASVLAGKSIATDPALAASFTVEPTSSTSRAAATSLKRLLSDGAFVHDGSPALTEQVAALRVVAGSDGPRLRSTSRQDAVKAAAWAVEKARALEPVLEVARIF